MRNGPLDHIHSPAATSSQVYTSRVETPQASLGRKSVRAHKSNVVAGPHCLVASNGFVFREGEKPITQGRNFR